LGGTVCPQHPPGAAPSCCYPLVLEGVPLSATWGLDWIEQGLKSHQTPELDQLLFKCISITKYKLLFKIVLSNTFFNYFCCVEQNTKYIFVKYLKYKILFELIAVKDRPSNFIAL